MDETTMIEDDGQGEAIETGERTKGNGQRPNVEEQVARLTQRVDRLLTQIAAQRQHDAALMRQTIAQIDDLTQLVGNVARTVQQQQANAGLSRASMAMRAPLGG